MPYLYELMMALADPQKWHDDVPGCGGQKRLLGGPTYNDDFHSSENL